MFDAAGHPLESLKLWQLVRSGNEAPVKADAVEDSMLTFDINAPVALPETVNAVMTDGSRQSIPVTWNISQAELDKMNAPQAAKYDIYGEAGGMKAHAQISKIKYNYVKNYSFEDGADNWVITDLAKADQLYVEDKVTDSLTGDKHLHFWSAAKNTVEFTAEQNVGVLPAGKYSFSISIMGGDAGITDIFAYVKAGGCELGIAHMKITSYGNWDTGTISGFEAPEDQEVTVGIYVKCAGAGAGAWGKIDDAILNSAD